MLFSELSAMFGKEVPLYDKSLLVNRVCNEAVCSLLSQMHKGFRITPEQLERTSGERHGAIRIGKPSEYRWVATFFEAFGLEPHNFYDMTNLGGKSQPIIATAFRSSHNPDHRVFCSLLMTDYFDADTRQRIEEVLATREVFSARAKELALRSREEGGLTWDEARELVREGTGRIFKWTGKARIHQLYKDLCQAGFKIAADIACFENHHLNHLTPNTLCMDLYTASMKYSMGEWDAEKYRTKAGKALQRLGASADRDYMKLHFKHVDPNEIDGYEEVLPAADAEKNILDSLCARLQESALQLKELKHSGFKDFTEGPPAGVPVLLRQDSYKALTEAVTFTEKDGTTIQTTHTARFGEIEQRFYATTPAGRALYDKSLEAAENSRANVPEMAKPDSEEAETCYASCFNGFPKTLRGLLEKQLVYARYTVTTKGTDARKDGSIRTTDPLELMRLGYLKVEGLRYEDFLPFSAAGIFASNLGQYGTKSTATAKPVYTRETLEKIMGKAIIESDVLYLGTEARSLLTGYHELGLLEKLESGQLSRLKADAALMTD